MGVGGEKRGLRRPALRRFRANVGKKSPRSTASPVSSRSGEPEDNSDHADSVSSKKSGPWSRFVFGGRGKKMEPVKKVDDSKAPPLSLQEDVSVEEWSHGSIPNGMLAVPDLSKRRESERKADVCGSKNSSEIHEVQDTSDTIRRVVPAALRHATRTVDPTSSRRFWADESFDHNEDEDEDEDSVAAKLRVNSSEEALKEESVDRLFGESDDKWSVGHWRSPVSVLDTALYFGDTQSIEEERSELTDASSPAGARIAAEWAISRSYAKLVKHEAEISMNQEGDDGINDEDDSSQRSC